MNNVVDGEDQTSAYAPQYSESGFWEKLGSYAKKAGREVVENALVLYYTLQDPDVPTKSKAIICGALGYFILPFDVIPDIVPVAGFTDDLAVLAAAITAVAINVSAETRQKARAKLVEWFD